MCTSIQVFPTCCQYSLSSCASWEALSESNLRKDQLGDQMQNGNHHMHWILTGLLNWLGGRLPYHDGTQIQASSTNFPLAGLNYLEVLFWTLEIHSLRCVHIHTQTPLCLKSTAAGKLFFKLNCCLLSKHTPADQPQRAPPQHLWYANWSQICNLPPLSL